jgi:hypothetical protein
MNARRRPSGDHAGALLDFFARVSWRGSVPAEVATIHISVSKAFSSQFVSRTVYATRRPSGEITGEPTRFNSSA